MSNHTTPHITRTALAGGKFRYEVDGKVHTAKSGRMYTHASTYVTSKDEVRRWRTAAGVDGETFVPAGTLSVWLHAREDLAAKGSPDANRMCPEWFHRVGVVEIAEVA